MRVADQSRIVALDGWRAISAGLVIIDHLTMLSSVRLEDIGPIAHYGYLPTLGALGKVGVQSFFVISGFVIFRGLLREVNDQGQVSLIGFYLRRVFRIIPPLLLYVLVIWCLAKMDVVDPVATGVVRALTFTCNIPGETCGGPLGQHTWTLSVEEQFYLVIPLLFIIFEARSKLMGTLVPIALFACFLILSLADLSRSASFVFKFLPIGIGVACAANEDRIRAAIDRIPVWAVYTVPLLLLVLGRLTHSRFALVAYIAIALLLPVILMATAFGQSSLRRVLSAKPLVAVGRVSYTIYLWQQLATHGFVGVGWGFYAITIALCIGWAFLSYTYFEGPLITLGRKLSGRPVGQRLARPRATT